MSIHLLDSKSIDKIAAGEVVERPSSVVKELVENAIDAKASIITVQIKKGGIEYIRISDNGTGIEPEDLPKAFLRHATSKIEDVSDLLYLNSLGFRGEALSSISAVSKVEIITKTAANLTARRMYLEGGVILEEEEAGAPNGTTFIISNLFYNTPARRKFLKAEATEAGYIKDLLEHLAIANPSISFTLIDEGRTRLSTSGNGSLKDVLINIFGREIKNELIEINFSDELMSIRGFLGKPVMIRSKRDYELFFVNTRYIKSAVLSAAVEDGYREYLMQHKFPFCVLDIRMDPKFVDCNVHPQKTEVRFSDENNVSKYITEKICNTLKAHEMIPKAYLTEEEKPVSEALPKYTLPEPILQFEANKTVSDYRANDFTIDFELDTFEEESLPESETTASDYESPSPSEPLTSEKDINNLSDSDAEKKTDNIDNTQLNLFEEKILSEDNLPKFSIIGQVFKTYWMIEYDNKLLIIDQHAAHEKVNYERFIKKYLEKTIVSQNLYPAIVITLTSREMMAYRDNASVFEKLGFEVSDFGGNEIKLTAVPTDLYGCEERELFTEVLDDLVENPYRGGKTRLEEKIASMSCKAAVKGNSEMSYAEMSQLITDLLTLENPYNCPHGRPTMIEISKYEMDKKFKRIV